MEKRQFDAPFNGKKSDHLDIYATTKNKLLTAFSEHKIVKENPLNSLILKNSWNFITFSITSIPPDLIGVNFTIEPPWLKYRLVFYGITFLRGIGLYGIVLYGGLFYLLVSMCIVELPLFVIYTLMKRRIRESLTTLAVFT